MIGKFAPWQRALAGHDDGALSEDAGDAPVFWSPVVPAMTLARTRFALLSSRRQLDRVGDKMDLPLLDLEAECVAGVLRLFALASPTARSVLVLRFEQGKVWEQRHMGPGDARPAYNLTRNAGAFTSILSDECLDFEWPRPVEQSSLAASTRTWDEATSSVWLGRGLDRRQAVGTLGIDALRD